MKSVTIYECPTSGKHKIGEEIWELWEHKEHFGIIYGDKTLYQELGEVEGKTYLLTSYVANNTKYHNFSEYQSVSDFLKTLPQKEEHVYNTSPVIDSVDIEEIEDIYNIRIIFREDQTFTLEYKVWWNDEDFTEYTVDRIEKDYIEEELKKPVYWHNSSPHYCNFVTNLEIQQFLKRI